ncbi:hypothetical protein GOODEAATRI_025133 [Goodea atripinnis]|uniref:Uncharacterized protein n=1 Tax=Goodea atripinnis TaxID=208336 RepID=A0ABV0PRH0_9TELE
MWSASRLNFCPLLFSLSSLPLGSILQKQGTAFHFYVEESPIFMPPNKEDSYYANQPLECIAEIESRPSIHFLQQHKSCCLSSTVVKTAVEFKILLLTYKALNDLAPSYIRDLIGPY